MSPPEPLLSLQHEGLLSSPCLAPFQCSRPEPEAANPEVHAPSADKISPAIGRAIPVPGKVAVFTRCWGHGTAGTVLRSTALGV